MTFKRAERRLLGAVRLLALPAEAQAAHLLQRGLEESTEELRLPYEEALAGAAPFIGREVSLSQAERLQALAAYLRTMATPDKARLWSDRALRHSVDWANVRELAATALVEFDAWPRRWGKGRRRLIRARAAAARRLKSP